MTALLLASLAACGKKGPPLAPLRVPPAPIADLALTKVGDKVQARFTLPLINDDKTQPVDIVAAELYALSGELRDADGGPLSGGDFSRYAKLAGRVDVKPVPKAGAEAPPPPAADAPPDTRPSPGQLALISETLGPYEPWVHPRARQRTTPEPVEAEPVRPLWWPPEEKVPSRSYIVQGVSSTGVYAAPSNRVTMPLLESPQPPGQPTLAHSENTISIAWTPSPGARVEIQAAPAPVAPPALPELTARAVVRGPPGTTYNVYPATRRDGQVVIAETPISQPLTVLAAGVVLEGFGQERCYVVRALRTFDAARVESEPSPVGCITPVDTYPPVAPVNLVAVGSEGGVSLIWDPNTDKDLGGYIVMRGDVGADGTAGALAPLMTEPIKETTYRDATTRAGARYVYTIVAVDQSTPANRGPESNRVEEGAR